MVRPNTLSNNCQISYFACYAPLRAWNSTSATGAWHPRNFWIVLSGTRWFWQFYYITLCFTLKIWRFTSDWHPPTVSNSLNSSPAASAICNNRRTHQSLCWGWHAEFSVGSTIFEGWYCKNLLLWFTRLTFGFDRSAVFTSRRCDHTESLNGRLLSGRCY